MADIEQDGEDEAVAVAPPKRGGRGRPSLEGKKYRRYRKKKRCRFCRNQIDEVDYKDLASLQKLVTAQGKMFSRKRSGSCARHQRSAKRAVKYARMLALLPYVDR